MVIRGTTSIQNQAKVSDEKTEITLLAERSLTSKCGDCHQRNRCLLRPLEIISQAIGRPLLSEHVYEASSTIVRENESIDKILVLKSGSVQLSNLDSTGKEQIFGFAFPNSILASEAIETRNSYLTIITLEKSRACKIEKAELLYAMRINSEFCRSFLSAVARQIMEEKKYTLKLCRGSVEARTAAFVLYLYEIYYPERSISTDIILSMPRSSISSFLDITPESLSRCLSNLSTQKLISVFNRRITILSIDGLKALTKG